ncbi:uncharacterized protein LOC116603311 [Nematostella vectensis]|uniref:uncharacterized protein LOC116603311 n=1 Tax=Nematostella vectensis TaxID=45351 RepID=UPI0020771D51|nr:uncharacterized protein LOC116603311 [Nematostella vectensis]
MVKQLPAFHFFRSAVVYHIPHEYSEVMTLPSIEVPLGCLPKNKTLNEDMVDIMEHIQEKYVPMTQANGRKTPADFVCFGGDQLTEKRARNIQKARADGRDVDDSLVGLWNKNEDWHGICIAYQLAVDVLRKPNSVMDWGTMTSNAIVSGNNNALKDTLDHYDSVKEFFAIEVDAFIIAATLNHFGMEDTTSVPQKMPENLKKSSKEAQRTWLHKEISSMLELLVMPGYSRLPGIISAYHPRPDLPCRGPNCDRIFKYSKCRIQHEEREHDLVAADEAITESESTSNYNEEDYIFNYGCLHLSIGLLLRDADDAVKEGDGERLLRVWNFLTVFYQLHKYTKYALAALRLRASQLALLTPREAHRLKWNRFSSIKGVQAKCISRDLRLEKINKVSKECIRAMGAPNVNSTLIESSTQSTGPLLKLLECSKQDLGQKARSTHHTNKIKQQTFVTVLEQVHKKAKVFTFQAGRKYASFPTLSRDLFDGVNAQLLHRWICKHRKKWHRQNRPYYKMQ